jgi:hypothetical protein
VSEIQDRPEHIKQIFVGRPGTPSEPLTRARLEREREKGGGGGGNGDGFPLCFRNVSGSGDK